MNAESDNLVPLFVPALGTVLKEYERRKGSPLSRQEVDEIRDRCTIVIVDVAKAEAMNKSRGFRDIDPEDCWGDWNNRKDQIVDKRTDQPAGGTLRR